MDAPLQSREQIEPGGPGRVQVALWVMAAVVAVGLLTAVLGWERQHPHALFGAPAGDPRQGEALFRTKRCAHCHPTGGGGGKLGPDLAGEKLGKPDRLLTAMWNHSHDMWDQAEREQIRLPTLTPEEIGHVSAYLGALPRASPDTSSLKP